MKTLLTILLLALLWQGQAQSIPGDVFQPTVELVLEVQPAMAWEGGDVVITATATTDSVTALPLELALELPPELSAHGSTRLTGPLSSAAPRTLTVVATAMERGEYELVARASGYGLEERARLTVRRPATLELTVEPAAEVVAVGDIAGFLVTVHNSGDLHARGVELEVPLPAGTAGEPLQLAFDLKPRGVARYLLEAEVLDVAPRSLSLTARANLAGGAVRSAGASIEVLRPQPLLMREVSSLVAVPGQEVSVTLIVENAGRVAFDYELAEVWPEWLDVTEATALRGSLAAGERVEHHYSGRVRFGSASEGSFRGELRVGNETIQLHQNLERRPVQMSVELDALRVRLGGTVAGKVHIGNPASQSLTIVLQASPDDSLGATQVPESVVVPAGGEVELDLELAPVRPGTFSYELAAFIAGVPVSFPVGVELTVLPPLVPERTSTVELPFAVAAEAGDSLLFSHELPAGSRYVPVSSLYLGEPAADPLQGGDDGNTLYWLLPYAGEGVLEYALEHEGPLGGLSEPGLTLVVGQIEVPLQGSATRADLELARGRSGNGAGFIVEPSDGTVLRGSDQTPLVLEAPFPAVVEVRVNGAAVPRELLGTAVFDEVAGRQRLEYYGVGLVPGPNRIEVGVGDERDEVTLWVASAPARLAFEPLSLVANGSSPVRLNVVGLDHHGLESGFGPVTVSVDAEPAAPDAFPDLPGYQLLLRDGRAVLELRPFTTPGPLRVAAAFNDVEAEETFRVGGGEETLLLGQASVTARFGPSGLELSGVARGYLEMPAANGTVQAAIDSGAQLLQPQLETDRFPILGTGTEARPALQSLDGVAARYDDAELTVGYFHDRVTVPGIADTFEATALRAEWRDIHLVRGELSVSGFAGLLPEGELTEEIEPDGTRLYRLAGPLARGSEEVTLVVGSGATAEKTILRRSVDYVIDYEVGNLALSSPIWPTSPDFRPVLLVVTYAPEGSARTQTAAGIGASYGGSDGLRASFGMMRRAGLELGATVEYEQDNWHLAMGYQLTEASGEHQASLSGGAELGPLAAEFTVRYDLPTAGVDGNATLRWQIDEGNSATIRHDLDTTGNLTAARFEHRLAGWTLGLGAEYDWEQAMPAAVAGVAWAGEGLAVSLSHRQPFTGVLGRSQLKVGMSVHEGLELEGGLAHEGGHGISGSIGLVQQIGEADLSIGYQLPTSSGEGNRARFGVSAPLPVDENWTLDLSAGYERSLVDGSSGAAGGIGARYSDGDISATVAADLSLGGPAPRVVFRGGAAGAADPFTSFTVDATFQLLPELEGRAQVGHAYRGGEQTLLSYHRLELGEDDLVEGEVAHVYHPRLDWQLQSTFAYRVPLDEPAGAVFQVSLGASFQPLSGLALGGAVHHQFQPVYGFSETGMSIEIGTEMMPGAWLYAGYGFGLTDGLTDESRGFYIRLDVVEGVQTQASTGVQEVQTPTQDMGQDVQTELPSEVKDRSEQ